MRGVLAALIPAVLVGSSGKAKRGGTADEGLCGGPQMDIFQAPAFAATKMAVLSDGCAAAVIRVNELTAQISDLRDRLNGRVVRAGDHPEKLRIDLERALEEQKMLQRQRPIEADILGRCRAWLAALPPGTVLEQIIPNVEDGLALGDVRTRIRKLKDQVEALKRVPVPASDIEQKVRTYVERLPMPIIGGIGVGESLTVQWPSGLHVLMAFLQPDVLVERLMAEIDRIADTPCPLAEREQQIAKLEEEIDRFQRTEEAIVVATGAPREPGCPPWVVLGVKAIEAPGVCRRVMSR
jgi:hypothetical protein